MPKNTLGQMKQILVSKEGLDTDKRDVLIGLLSELESECDALPVGKQEEAKAVIKLAHQKLENLEGVPSQEIPYGDLEDAALEFETSHPKFTYIVQSICQSLAGLGI
ncbi:DUF4404 family protein [Francisellaceae bacterium]|nr:DUF4404 family protein [Francisellaceae bacterium]